MHKQHTTREHYNELNEDNKKHSKDHHKKLKKTKTYHFAN